ncbi:MAG TPA: translocation/assembly module TamB domain-containing protein [Arenicellales bacterium]|nr:translocation/assembly module TamB domain-containing protein [Arenicellales bacterium]
MTRAAIILLVLLGLASAMLAFVLGSNAGLRWALDRTLAFTDAPLEIGTVRGRLIGPLSLGGIVYTDPASGTVASVQSVELDWRPAALLQGLAHVTRLHVSGIEYAAGTGTTDEAAAAPASLPEISLPLAVRLDDFRLDSLAVADGSGTAAELVSHASLRAAADAGSVKLSDITVDAGRYSIGNGRIRLEFAPGMPVEANLDWRAAAPELPELGGNLVITGAIGGTLMPLVKVTTPFKAAVDGTLDKLLDGPEWTVALNLPEPLALQRINEAWPALSLQGTLRGSGDTGQARLQPELTLVQNDLTATLEGDVRVSPEAVVVDRARLARAGTSDAVNLSGRVTLEGDWSLQADIPRAVALDGLQPGLPPVSVHGAIQAAGDSSRAKLEPALSLGYRELAATLTGEIEASPDEVKVNWTRLQEDGGPGSLNLSGRVGLSDALPFSVRGDWQSLHGPAGAAWRSRAGELSAEGDRSAVSASLSGVISPPEQSDESPLSLEAKATGLDSQPALTASARLPYIAYAGVTARDMQLDLDYRASGQPLSEVTLQVADIRASGRRARDIRLRIDGAPEDHAVTLSGTMDDWAVSTALTGEYRDDAWSGRLERLTATPPEGAGAGQWALAAPAGLAWAADGSEIGEICVADAETRICASGSIDAQGWQAAATLSGLPLRTIAGERVEQLRIDGILEANASLTGADEGISGEASARVDRATVTWQDEEPIETEYRDLAVDATLTPERLRATINGEVDESGTIEGEVVTRDPLAADGALQGRLSLRLPSLRLVQAAVPALGLSQGSAELDLGLDGTRSAPQVSGDGGLRDVTLNIAPLGIELEALNLDVGSDDSRRFDIEARTRSGDGNLTLNGYLDWPGDGSWQAQARVGGDNAELARLPVATVAGSPDLEIRADDGGGRVDGRLRITRAEITPEAGRPGVTISDDIVVKGREETEGTRNPMAWHARVALDMGDNTHFRGYGLKGRLTGEIEIDAPPRQPPRANGSIQVVDGEYSLYGRSFDIERGRVIYTGGPIDNPGIDVAVGREVRDVSVSLAVTGPLVDPELQLSSTPAMSDTDRMSYLLLGRPASEASGAEAGLLLRAAASLIPGGGGSGVQARVQSALGLDTLQVQAESEEAEGAAVELGKYLAPDLYVSYIAGFQKAVDIFRVRYDFARHWLLQAESTTRGSGADVLLTW